jgi:Transglycosylase SLT domain
MKAAWRILVGASCFAISIGSAYPAIPNKEQVIETILQASRDAGVDEIYMLALADKESSLNPIAKARTSSAIGLYQFIEQTWLEAIWRFGGKHDLVFLSTTILKSANGKFIVPDKKARETILDLRRDPYVSTVMAAELLKNDREMIEEKLGRDLKRREFYLMHFLGRQGAHRLIEVMSESPEIRASAIFPEAAAANRAIFYDKPTVKTVLRTVVKKRRKKVTYKKVRVRVTVHNHRSVEKVYTNLGDMILKRMARFGI